MGPNWSQNHCVWADQPSSSNPWKDQLSNKLQYVADQAQLYRYLQIQHSSLYSKFFYIYPIKYYSF